MIKIRTLLRAIQSYIKDRSASMITVVKNILIRIDWVFMKYLNVK